MSDHTLDHWWKENFRFARATFEYICSLVGPAFRLQDTHMRDAIPVDKRVGASLWRLANGECYRSCGLVIGLSKSTVVKCCHEFLQQLCVLKGNYIKERFSNVFTQTANVRLKFPVYQKLVKFIRFQFIFCLLATAMVQVLKTEK